MHPPDGDPDRAVSPAETVARVRPHMAAMGITRLADLTGLDRIGVPVFAAIRPNARSVASRQGKSLTEEAARRGIGRELAPGADRAALAAGQRRRTARSAADRRTMSRAGS